MKTFLFQKNINVKAVPEGDEGKLQKAQIDVD